MIRQPGDDIFGIGHLRDALRMDKTRHFQPLCTVINHAIDQSEFVFG